MEQMNTIKQLDMKGTCHVLLTFNRSTPPPVVSADTQRLVMTQVFMGFVF